MADLDKRLLNLAEHIADGHTPDFDQLGGDGLAQDNLLKIMQLSEAFQQAREEVSGGGVRPQFRWCHLDVFEQIGAGGFGEVYRAFDRVLDREVALKLRRHSGNEDQMIQEARRMARVRHPNVLAVHGADIDNGRAGIWSDLLKGQTLEQRLKAGQHADDGRLLTICIDLTGALLAIHEKELTHGDIKASNVMLEPDGTPILMDFGAAEDQSGPTASPAHGSPLVMAPELLDGDRSCDKTDVYSLGVLFFRLCCGRYPIAGSGMDALRAAHRERQALDFTGVPRPFRKVLSAMLSPEPHLRPTTQQCLDALRQLAARPRVRRRRFAIGVVFVALIAGLAALSVGFYQARQAAAQARLSQAEAQQSLDFLTSVLAAPQGRNQGAEVKVVDVIDSAQSELTFAPPASARQHAIMAHTLGITYKALGALEKAEALLTLANTKWDAVSNSEHGMSRLRTQHALGATFVGRGKLDEAGLILQQVLDQLPHEGADVAYMRALTLVELSSVAHNKGEEAKRDSLLEQAQAALPATEARDTLQATIALEQAFNLIRTNPLAAEKRALTARAWLNRVGQSESFTMYDSDRVLATIWLELGKFAEAETLLRDSLARAKIRFGELSGVRINLMSLLSATLDRRGRSNEALTMEKALVDLVTKVHGPSHISTLMVRNNLAIRYQNLGQYEQAIDIYQNVVSIFSEQFSHDHPQRLLTLGNLAESLLIAGRLTDAETTARRAHAADLKKFGPEHIVTLFVVDVLGAALSRQGRVDEAIDLLRENHAVKVRQFGEHNPYTHDTAFYLAEALLKLGESATAAVLLEGVVENRQKDLGPDHDKTQEAAGLLKLAASTDQAKSKTSALD